MIRRFVSRCWASITTGMVAAMVLSGAGCASRPAIQELPEEVRAVVGEVADAPGRDPWTTVVYGPEWETLEIVDRRIIGGELRCVAYGGGTVHFAKALENATLWYATRDPESIGEYQALRAELPHGRIVRGRPERSSNPAVQIHLIGAAGTAMHIESPWSGNSASSYASNVILLHAALDEEIPGSYAQTQEWVDPLEMAARHLAYMHLPPDPAFFLSLAIDYFDLRQRIAASLAASGTN